jgi:hypothetical protein
LDQSYDNPPNKQANKQTKRNKTNWMDHKCVRKIVGETKERKKERNKTKNFKRYLSFFDDFSIPFISHRIITFSTSPT